MAKMVSGKKYAEAEEKYEKKTAKKTAKSMKTAGVANEFKESKKMNSVAKKPKVKPQKKMGKLDIKKGQGY